MRASRTTSWPRISLGYPKLGHSPSRSSASAPRRARRLERRVVPGGERGADALPSRVSDDAHRELRTSLGRTAGEGAGAIRAPVVDDDDVVDEARNHLDDARDVSLLPVGRDD